MAEFAIDYLDSLSTVPLAERQPQLRQPLYSSLLQVLFPCMQYPQGFTTWDEWVDDDEEAFTRFRYQTPQLVSDLKKMLLRCHDFCLKCSACGTYTCFEVAHFSLYAHDW